VRTDFVLSILVVFAAGHALAQPAVDSEPAEVEPTAEVAPLPDSPAESEPESEEPGDPGELPRADQARGWQESPGVEGEDVVLFLPRAVLFLPNWALRIVFWPLRQGLEVMDRYAILGHIEDLLYNDARTMGVFPLVSFQSDFGVTGGAKIFHKDVLGHDERLSLSAKYGGFFQQSYDLHWDADRLRGSRFYLEGRARFEEKPRLFFYGIGNRDESEAEPGVHLDPHMAAVETRHAEQRVLGVLRGGYALGRPGEQMRLGVSAVFNSRRFGAVEGDRSGDVSTETVYDVSALPGFEDGSDVLELSGVVELDFRDTSGLASRGMFVEMFVGAALPGIGDYNFVHWGVEATGYVDLFRGDRVLMMRLAAEAVHDEVDGVPFADLPRLGGGNRLRGYPVDRFRDQRAVVGTLEYHYPIHWLLAGTLFVDVGRVGRTFAGILDFKDGGWRFGYGGGLILGDPDDVSLRLEVAGGDGIQFHLSADVLRAFAGREDRL